MSIKDNFLGQLFPTKLSLVIFVAYICLFVNQGILVKASQNNGTNNKYDYNIVTVVIGTELIKLVTSLVLYFKDKPSIWQLFDEIRSGFRIGLLYLIPAFLYCLYNNLAFINLANYDPTTYFILLQFRTVITGSLFQILFNKKLTSLQWFSLCLLTIACMIKELGHSIESSSSDSFNILSALMSKNLFLIMLQLFCSSFAGVYNEFLLKNDGNAVHIIVQNIFMYLDSILCNLALLLITSNPLANNGVIFDLSVLSNLYVWFIMFNGAIAGIVTSFFLKNLNSILKTFASTLEILLSAILCSLLFSTIINIHTIISISLVFLAIYIYAMKPVQNFPINSSLSNRTDHMNISDDVKLLIKD
ncbi:hypothetical protein DERF_008786 [Dermatophagoides farinae]|uniref:Uncharacterized protein n=1 Tax=Dermatophagoides farinae TaxID=6954 RepID=A0A922I1M4_DERFA|nr:UDP-galactose transporter senju-like [Dermatophagoides farinae]KAH7641802.1 hypothetical protein HUG17_4847 [Dermatophagoides farinae]KAH9518193.1 hypothetical protein DERF_008786 [Dermatophagoides farinae]